MHRTMRRRWRRCLLLAAQGTRVVIKGLHMFLLTVEAWCGPSSGCLGACWICPAGAHGHGEVQVQG